MHISRTLPLTQPQPTPHSFSPAPFPPAPPPLTTCPPSSLARFRSPPMLLVYPRARLFSLSPYPPHGSGDSLRASDPPRQGGATQTSQPQATGVNFRFSPSLGKLERRTSSPSAHCPIRPSDATASSIPSIPSLSRSHSASSSITCASNGAMSTFRFV